MLDLTRFPVATKWVIGFLTEQLALRPEPYAEAFVSNETDNPRSDRIVVVFQSGGPELTVASRMARMVVNVYALTDSDADDLAELVQALLRASVGVDQVRKVTVGGVSSLPDVEDHKRRYFPVEITLRSL